jgi:hypothetical protein
VLSFHTLSQVPPPLTAPPARVEFPDARVLPTRLRPSTQLGLALLFLVFAALPLAALGLPGVLLCIAAVIPLLVLRRRQSAGRTRVSASPQRLFIDGREVLQRRDLSYVYVTRRATGATVHLLRSAAPAVELTFADPARAEALLDALDARSLPLTRFRVDSPASSRLPAWLAWAFAGVVIVSNAAGLQRVVSPAEVFALLMVWAVLAVVLGSVGAELVVGHDALVLRWFGRERVIPLARIAEVHPVVEGVSITLTNGEVEQVHVRFAPPRYEGALRAHDSRAAWQRAILARIEEARAHAREAARDAVLPPLADHDPAAWVDALRAAKRDGHYRARSLTDAQLWEAVEDPQAHAAQRAAAAIALSPSLDDAGRTRLRIAAEGVATPQVRFALEAVARSDEEALLEAVEQLTPRREARG